MSETVVETDFITLTAAAARAGKCEATVRGWLKRKRLRGYRVLGRLVVAADELDALLRGESQPVESTAAAS